MSSKNKISDALLLNSIRGLKNDIPWYTAGYKKITRILRERYETPINKKRVYRIMKKHGLLQTPYKRIKKRHPAIFYQTMFISKWVKWEVMRKLRSLKKDMGWSWENIAKEIGASKRTLLRWNNQRKVEPSINRSHMTKILGLLDRNDYSPRMSRVLHFDLCFEDFFDNADRYREFYKSYSKYYRNPPKKKRKQPKNLRKVSGRTPKKPR